MKCILGRSANDKNSTQAAETRAMPQNSEQRIRDTFRFEDLPLAACFIYRGFQLDVEAPTLPDGLVTFLVHRTRETEKLLQDFATSGLSVDARRFYDSLGIAKRLVHRARAAEQ